MLEFINQIYKNLNDNLEILTIFVDLSKAFDCVCHSELLNKVLDFRI